MQSTNANIFSHKYFWNINYNACTYQNWKLFLQIWTQSVYENQYKYQGAEASQVAWWWKICLSMQETQEKQVRSLSQEDPLEEEMATQPSILAWKIPWTEEQGWVQFMGLQKAGLNWATKYAQTDTRLSAWWGPLFQVHYSLSGLLVKAEVTQ